MVAVPDKMVMEPTMDPAPPSIVALAEALEFNREEARARLGFTKADLWPTFDYLVSAGVSDPTKQNPPLPGDLS